MYIGNLILLGINNFSAAVLAPAPGFGSVYGGMYIPEYSAWVDGVIPEPVGGAHRGPAEAAESLKRAIVENIDRLSTSPVDDLLNRRLEKYSKMGTFLE